MTNPIATAFTSVPSLNSTLTIDTSLWLGHNQIRRSIGKNTSLYIGDSVNDQYVKLDVGGSETLTFDGPIGAICVQTSAPIIADITVNTVTYSVTINKLLVIDDAVTAVTLRNPVGSASQAQAHVSYVK